jgi:hypothetical protein
MYAVLIDRGSALSLASLEPFLLLKNRSRQNIRDATEKGVGGKVFEGPLFGFGALR